MATPNLPTVLHRFARTSDGAPDAQLLDRFVETGDEAAFELLVWRHGPAVLAACRRVLRHDQDAEDAFQATFLTLARKARSVARGGAVGGWLRRVAVRAAVAAKARAARRPTVTGELGDVPAPAGEPAATDLRPVLDDEIGRLPDRYREPFLLCHRDGLTVDEAARRLGRPRGTIGTRIARARARLRERLAARGVVPGVLAALAAPAADASARLSAELVSATVRLVRTGPGAVPASILTLSDGVTRAMFLSQLKAGLAIVLAATALGAGGLALRPAAADDKPAAAAPAPAGKLTFGGWGAVVDPDGDCKFTLDRNTLSIRVPGSDHVLGVERKRMNAPRVLQEVEGDFILQARVPGGFPNPEKTLVPQRRPLMVAGLLLYVDDRTFVRLERASLNFDGERRFYPNWEVRTAGEWNRAGGTQDGTIDGKAQVWLRLERRGGRLLGSHSDDGLTWRGLEPVEVKLPKTVRVGVTAGNNTTTPFTATFEGMQLFRCVAGTAPAEPAAGSIKLTSESLFRAFDRKGKD